MKKIISFLVVSILLLQNLPTSYASEVSTLSFSWVVEITSMELADELYSEEVQTLYSGASQVVATQNKPEDENNQYLLLDVYVYKDGEESDGFSISSLSLSLEGESYEQIENSILESHNMDSFTTNELKFGESEGYIAFEIPKDADLETGYLSINGEEVALEVTEPVYEEPYTNIPVEENIMETQWDIEVQLLEDYNAGEYTLESPYVVLDPYGWTPLSALVIFETDENATVTIEVLGKDEYTTIVNEFDTFETSHQIPVVGMYADYLNTVTITVTYGDGTTEETVVYIQTEALIEDSDLLEVVLVESTPELMQEGMTFLAPTGLDKYSMAVDCYGEVRWIIYHNTKQITRRLENGNIILLDDDYATITEMDLLGKVYGQYKDPAGVHHDVIELPNGNFLTTSKSDGYYVDDLIYELDRETGEVVNCIDLKDILDVSRFNSGDDSDWIHLNSLWYDESDDTLVISGRHQGIFKISYPDGELEWIITYEAELDGLEDVYLTPIGDDYDPPVNQHAAMIMPDQDDNPDTVDVMIFDNNIARLDMPAEETDMQYSRLVQYRVDEVNMTVEQIWSYGEELGYDYFGDIVGDVDYFENGNIIGTFGRRNSILEAEGHDTGTIIEVIKDTEEVVFQIDVISQDGEAIYRSERLTLYPDEWDFELLSQEVETHPSNSTSVVEDTIDFEDIVIEDTWTINDTTLSLFATIDESYGELSISGFQLIEGVDCELYSAKIIFESDTVSKAIDVELVEEDWIGAFANDYFSDTVYYDKSQFSEIFSMDAIEKVLPDDTYTLGILLEADGYYEYTPWVYYITIGQETTQMEVDDYLISQNITSDELESVVVNGDYTLEDPLVILDPYDVSPLTAIVGFYTEMTGSVDIEIVGKDESSTISYSFEEVTDEHLIPVYGLYADTNNTLHITFTAKSGEVTEQTVYIQTEALPSDMPTVDIEVYDETLVAEGFTFACSTYLMAYDINGDIRWYLSDGFLNTATNPIKYLDNGNMMLASDKLVASAYYTSSLYEIDMLGRIYNEYIINGAHHEIFELENGDLVVAAEKDHETTEDYIVLLDRETGEVENSWDLDEILGVDPIADETYQSQTYDTVVNNNPDATEEELLVLTEESSRNDWFHNNSLYYNEEDGSITVSGRQKDIVMNFDAETNEINWILSDPSAEWTEELADNLLTPIGVDFEYTYGQHAISILEDGDLLVYDNGNFRSKDVETALDSTENYSRIVRYEIDTEAMTVEQVFEYGSERNELYTPYIGDADYLGEDHYLANFGGIILDGYGYNMDTPSALFSGGGTVSGEAVQVELVDGEVVLEARLTGTSSVNTYRVERMNIYTDQVSYVDLSTEAQLLGSGWETEYISDIELPEMTQQVAFSVNTAIDQNSRMVMNISQLNKLDGVEELYIVLEHEEDIRLYEAEDSTDLYINKDGLLEGEYKLGALVVLEDGISYYSTLEQVITIFTVERVESDTQKDSVEFNKTLISAFNIFLVLGASVIILLYAKKRKKY
ncbi:MAG: aryl-sulfate sulfotransferase [Lachnospiraceae bacterium]